MKPMITKPTMLKYLGKELYFTEADFLALKEFRAKRSADILNCYCQYDDSGETYRVSFFGQQQPTELKPGGELDPTELINHFDTHTTKCIAELVKQDDPFNFDNWVSETGGKITRFYQK